MAGSARKGDRGLNILLLRHGESTNNTLMAEIYGMQSGKVQDAEAEWLRRRQDDPPLTATGVAEARAFAAAYAPRLAKAVGPKGQVRVFVSPFKRTCDTALPLVKALRTLKCSTTVCLRRELHEVGGCYSVGADGRRSGPGKCLTPAEIEAGYPGFDVSGLLHGPDPEASRHRGWYFAGWETDAEGRRRAGALASWLRSPGLREECLKDGGGSWVVLVCHGHLVDLLVKALLGVEDNPADDVANINVFTRSGFTVYTPNTAVGHFVVHSNGSLGLHSLGRVDHLSLPSSLTRQVVLSGVAASLGFVAALALSRQWRSSL